jgi:hypothetical protein
MTNLAIIIVSWNVCGLLANCLHTVQADLEYSRLTGQVWVVDNASSDGTVAMLRRDFPHVNLIAGDKNLGFAAGNNTALRAMGFGSNSSKALPDMVLLLNPDTEVHPGALRELYNFMQRNPQAGVVGARLVYGDGSFQHSAFAFPGLWQLAIELLPLPGRLIESSLNGRYPPSLYESGQPFPIGHPLGAALSVRREAIQQVGLMDEQYHMYVEEIDWSKRMRLAGWPAYCVPTAVITHLGGQSTGQIKLTSFINLWTSRCLFYRKFYAPPKFWLARQIAQVGMRRLAYQAKQAASQGLLSQADLEKQLAAYQQVVNIWQGV